MKTLFISEAISKGARSGTVQSPDGLLNKLEEIVTSSSEFLNRGREPAGFKEFSRGVERSDTPGLSSPIQQRC